MPLRFAANLSLMFNEWAFEDRFAAAREAGFEGVEFFPPEGISAERLSALLTQQGQTLVLSNMPLRAGSKGFAALPDAVATFRADFDLALELALACSAATLHVTSGCVSTSALGEANNTFKSNIEWALARADGKVSLVIEAINQTAAPEYFIRSLAKARQWVSLIPGLRLIMDVYHAAMEGLDVVAAINDSLPFTDHIQLAGWPGRHEPNVGDLPLTTILKTIQDGPYAGWVGCEYVPQGRTTDGLDWICTRDQRND